MQSRGTIYVATLLILTGLFFLAINIAGPLLHLGWGQLWPGLLALGALAFYLPIFVWWRRRRELAGLAVPGTILLANALILFYNACSGDWNAWSYLWSLEPLAVGLGLYAAWLVGTRPHGLLVGGHVLSIIGLLLFIVFGALFGARPARVLAPFVLIGLGILLLLRSLIGRGRRGAPRPPAGPKAALG